ncbi:MAG: hypothetical protein ABIJ45_05445, partial [Candidatus Zixiibacteriota bacterium]
MFGISELTIDFLTGHPFITALIFALFILLSIYLYRSTNPPLSKGMRIVFVTLRIIAVIVLFLALFEPVVSFQREYIQKPVLTILADRSGSMDIADEGISRTAVVDSILNDSRFKRFLSAFDYKVAEFSYDLFDSPESRNKDRTGLGRTLRTMSDKQVGQPARAWLLLSDGISNDGIAPLEACQNLKTQVYTIGIGRQSSERDVAISSLDYNDIIFAGKPTELTAHIAWNGLNNEKIFLNIKSGEKVIGSEEIVGSPGNVKEDVRIKYTAEAPGQQTFRLSLSGVENEVTTDNNQRSFSATVLKGKMNVLLVADRLDWEYAFLKRFLANSESVSLETVVYKKDGGYLSGNLPNRIEEMNRFDLIVLYDVDINKLKGQKSLFDSYLRDKGGSLLVMLGENYLKASFPRWLDDFLPLINKFGGTGIIYSNFSGMPSENYLFHPAVKLADNRQAIRESWRAMPHFEALVPTDSIAPNAEILVTADLQLGDINPPIVGLRKIGSGRVLAMAALPMWHWAFYGFGFGDDDQEYRLILDGIVNWLSVRKESDPIKIRPDKNVFTRGEMVGFNIQAF